MTAALAAPNPDRVTTAILVPGMHCAGCIGKVERNLLSLPDVSLARANLSKRTVTIEHGARLV